MDESAQNRFVSKRQCALGRSLKDVMPGVRAAGMLSVIETERPDASYKMADPTRVLVSLVPLDRTATRTSDESERSDHRGL